MVGNNKKTTKFNEDENGDGLIEERDFMGDDDYYKQYVTHEKILSKRKCNLCGKSFQPNSKFERFCNECKKENELYHFYE